MGNRDRQKLNKKRQKLYPYHQVSAGGIVIKDRKVLLLKKFSGLYCFPKGRVEKGETLEETALREVKEETNVSGRVIDYIGKMKYSYKSYKKGMVINKEVHWYLMEPMTLNLIPQKKEGFCKAFFCEYDDAIKNLKFHNERTLVREAMEMYEERDEFHQNSEK